MRTFAAPRTNGSYAQLVYFAKSRGQPKLDRHHRINMLRCSPSKQTLAHERSILACWMTASRTNRPDAPAAIAHAAFPRSCGRFLAALQPASWKRPFKATNSVDFKPTFRRVMFELTHRGQSLLSLHLRQWRLSGALLKQLISFSDLYA